jgi:sortase A
MHLVFLEADMKKTNWMIVLGAILLVVGAVNLWLDYQANVVSPFDMLDEGSGGEEFIPIVAYADPGSSAPDALASFAPTMSAAAVPEHSLPAAARPVAPPADGSAPGRLVIPSIFLDAPVIPVHYRDIQVDGQVYHQWRVPAEFAVGWQDASARLGLPGNTVFNGHHNAYGKVFENLVELKVGDLIQVFSGEWEYRYAVVSKMLLPERYQTLEVRMENARWLEQSTDERLTLVTCWPAESNTHRVVVVALPTGAPVYHPADAAAGQ